MAKLYFKYGTVSSAKTLNLLAVAHSYKSQNKKVLLVKPEIDSRWGKDVIKSRAGLEQKADIVLTDISDILNNSDIRNSELACVLVDEAQFLSHSAINALRFVATSLDVPVICYGLRSDFKSFLFEGSRRLFEIADSIEEIENTCFFCNKKATQNLKHVNGKPTIFGDSIDLGAEEKYLPVCYACYEHKIASSYEGSLKVRIDGSTFDENLVG
jgi:thymidine kinase